MNAFLMLNRKLRETILKYGYSKPVETQEKAIPRILKGENLLLIAPTGSGKTEAALFPIINLIMEDPAKNGIKALYITPLRALNRDIFRRIAQLAWDVDVKVEIRHGDTSQHVRRRQALKPPQILVTTPETLQAILPGKIMKKHLKNVRWVVIDEVHELISDKRGTQLALALERLERIAGESIQRIGLSATVGSPEKVAKYIAGTGREIEIIDITSAKRFEINVDVAEEDELNLKLAEKLLISPSTAAKLTYILKIAEREGSILVFTNTREMAEALASRLRILNPPFKIGVHHGSLSKEERVKVEEEFKRGNIGVLVATSSLELGLDIGVVNHVVQYMSPRQAAKLIQRVGRAGHKLWETSRGTILASTLDDIVESAVLARRAMSRELEETETYENSLDVLAHQMVGIILDMGGATLKEIFKIVRKAYPYRRIIFEDLRDVAAFLSDIGIIRYEAVDERLKTRRNRTWKYYYENLSVIPDIRRYRIIDIASRKPIGTLDEEFIFLHGKETFILAGRTWKTVRIDEEERTLYVEEDKESLGAIPAWIGELIPVPFSVAQEAGRLREKIFHGGEDLEKYPISLKALEKARIELKKHVEGGNLIPTDKRIIIEGLGKYIVIHSCLGTRTNRTLATLLAREIIKRLKSSVRISTDQYRILLILPRPVKSESIRKLIMELKLEGREIREAVKASDAYKWKLFHVSRRLGVITREARIEDVRRIISILDGTIAEKEALREALQDYFNIRRLKEILNNIRNGRIKVISVKRDLKTGSSTLASYILQRNLPYDLIPPINGAKTIIEIVKERLLNRKVKLACIHCGRWRRVSKIKYIPEDLRCPICGAKAIGVTEEDTEILKILSKWRRGKLNMEEREKFERFRKTVGLIMTYGKKAIITLAGRGIGPQTASRILRRYHEDEDELYMDILEAERNYIRTRPYWEE